MRRAVTVLLLALGACPATRRRGRTSSSCPGPRSRRRHLPQLVRLRRAVRACRRRTPRLGRCRRRRADGARATRLALPATGHASGPVGRVDRVGGATWSMWVRPVTGGQGVAHVWYVSGELGDGEVW